MSFYFSYDVSFQDGKQYKADAGDQSLYAEQCADPYSAGFYVKNYNDTCHNRQDPSYYHDPW